MRKWLRNLSEQAQELRHRGTDSQLARIASAIPRHGGTYAPHPAQLGPYATVEHARDMIRGCEAVVHLAAISNPRIGSPESTFRVNVQGIWATLQAAEDVGVRRVVVASSDATTGLLYNPKN